MPTGRPTDYRTEFCDKVLAWGKRGKSKAWIAAEIGVVVQTLENWEAAHPEFLDALGRAMTLSQRWWEDKGQSSLSRKGFQGNMWGRNMAARFPADWRETSKNIQAGDPNEPLMHVHEIVRRIIKPAESAT